MHHSHPAASSQFEWSRWRWAQSSQTQPRWTPSSADCGMLRTNTAVTGSCVIFSPPALAPVAEEAVAGGLGSAAAPECSAAAGDGLVATGSLRRRRRAHLRGDGRVRRRSLRLLRHPAVGAAVVLAGGEGSGFSGFFAAPICSRITAAADGAGARRRGGSGGSGGGGGRFVSRDVNLGRRRGAGRGRRCRYYRVHESHDVVEDVVPTPRREHKRLRKRSALVAAVTAAAAADDGGARHHDHHASPDGVRRVHGRHLAPLAPVPELLEPRGSPPAFAPSDRRRRPSRAAGALGAHTCSVLLLL